jgi:hypothetical protein
MQKTKKPILLSSMPKAGTYFFAEILSGIDAENRHLHVARYHAENLLLVDEETNRLHPSKAKIPLKLDQALYTVQGGEFVFGHIAKPLLSKFFQERFKIVYLFRNHKDALEAEFYWFREIRQDMKKKFTRFSHLSPEKHFIEYLKLFGHSRIRLFNFLDLWKADPEVISVDFDKFRADKDYALKSVLDIAKHIEIPCDENQAKEILEKSFGKDTKTKTKRDHSVNLWTPEAEKIYSKLLRWQKFYDLIYPVYWNLRKLLN